MWKGRIVGGGESREWTTREHRMLSVWEGRPGIIGVGEIIGMDCNST